jgi:hypothetical protein
MSVPSGGLPLQLHHGDHHRVDLRTERSHIISEIVEAALYIVWRSRRGCLVIDGLRDN